MANSCITIFFAVTVLCTIVLADSNDYTPYLGGTIAGMDGQTDVCIWDKAFEPNLLAVKAIFDEKKRTSIVNNPKYLVRVVPRTGNETAKPNELDGKELFAKGSGFLKKRELPDLPCNWFVVQREISKLVILTKGDKKADAKGDKKGDKKSDKKDEKKPDAKGDKKPDAKGDKKPDAKGDKKPDAKGDKKPDAKGKK